MDLKQSSSEITLPIYTDNWQELTEMFGKQAASHKCTHLLTPKGSVFALPPGEAGKQVIFEIVKESALVNEDMWEMKHDHGYYDFLSDDEELRSHDDITSVPLGDGVLHIWSTSIHLECNPIFDMIMKWLDFYQQISWFWRLKFVGSFAPSGFLAAVLPIMCPDIHKPNHQSSGSPSLLQLARMMSYYHIPVNDEETPITLNLLFKVIYVSGHLGKRNRIMAKISRRLLPVLISEIEKDSHVLYNLGTWLPANKFGYIGQYESAYKYILTQWSRD